MSWDASGPTTMAPIYVGAFQSGFDVAPGSVAGASRLAVDKTIGVVAGLSGEKRMFTDYLAINGNLGYGYSENFNTYLITVGPMVKLLPNNRVDPYAFFDIGVGIFSPKRDLMLETGESLDLEVFGTLAMDFGGGILIAATDNFSVDLQGRFHRLKLDRCSCERPATSVVTISSWKSPRSFRSSGWAFVMHASDRQEKMARRLPPLRTGTDS